MTIAAGAPEGVRIPVYFARTNDRFWRFWMNYAVHGSRNVELRRHQNHWFQKKNSFWAKLAQEAARCGELSTELDPIDTAEQLSIFTHGLMVWQILQPEPKTQAHCHKLLAAYFDRLEVRASGSHAKAKAGRKECDHAAEMRRPDHALLPRPWMHRVFLLDTSITMRRPGLRRLQDAGWPQAGLHDKGEVVRRRKSPQQRR